MALMDDVEYSGKNDEGIEDDFMYRNNVHNATVQIRLGFFRKVYSLLFVQLLLTTIFGFTLMAVEPVKLFVQDNTWMITVGFLLNLVILISLHIMRKETPINFILLAIFTVIEAYTIGVIVTFYDQFVVMIAFVLALAIAGGPTAYTFQTKRDFSNLGVVLFAALVILIIGGLFQAYAGSSIFAIFGPFIFSFLIIYDTQDEDKSDEEYSPNKKAKGAAEAKKGAKGTKERAHTPTATKTGKELERKGKRLAPKEEAVVENSPKLAHSPLSSLLSLVQTKWHGTR